MNSLKNRKINYDFLITVSTAGVGDGHGGSASLAVPGEGALFGNTAHRQRVDGRDVAITVAVISSTTAITGCPHVDHSFTLSALNQPFQIDF